MVLYHVISSYQLLCAIVHKAMRQEHEGVIIISQWIKDKIYNLQLLERFFNRVIVMNAMIDSEGENFYSDRNTEYIESLFSREGVEFSKIEEIHVAGAQYRFGAYLTENKIPYIYWEEASGLLSRPDVLMKNEASQPDKQQYCIRNGLYDGKNDVIIKRICNRNAQIEGFEDDLAEHFDVTEELGKLSDEERRVIVNIFAPIENDIELPENSVLFLTQHFANLQIMSFEEQALMYQLVIDYFFEDEEVVFKPHPDDLMYYSLLFPNSQVIRERFPSEFLPFIFTNKPKMIATISSTGAYNLRSAFTDFFSLDFRFQEHFSMIHRYYAAIQVTKKLGISFQEISLIGADYELIKKLYDSFEQNCSLKADVLYIVDDILLSNDFNRDTIFELETNLPENGAIIFINSKKDYCFHNQEYKGIWNYIIPLCLKKSRIREEEFFSDLEEDTIYFFSKSEVLLAMVEKFEFSRELKYAGLDVSLEKLTEEQKQIKVLEGVLKATEERLGYYMNLVDKEIEK